MLAILRTPALLLSALAPQDVVERGAPWYWPVGDAFEPGRILQGYGQYETVNYVVPPGDEPYDYYTAHKGLDVEATLDEEVRAPIAGTVLGVYCPATTCPDGSATTSDPYGSVILGAESGEWGLTVSHLYDITVMVDDHVEKGEVLGRAVAWAELPAFTHVHLGIFSPQPASVYYGTKTYVGDPLMFLGGRSDERSPYFLDIESGSDSYWPVAFVDDVTIGTAPSFHAPDALPQERLDILARVGDHFSTGFLVSFSVMPFSGLIPTLADLIAVAHFELETLALLSSKVMPARLSVRITSEVDGQAIFENTVEFTGEVSDVAYLEPSSTSAAIASAGWPDADFYVLLTHSATEAGTWDTSTLSGKYTVEVTAEDAAGNIEYASTSVEVLGP